MTHRTRTRRRPTAAALALTGLLALGGLAACGEDDEPTAQDPVDATPSGTPEPTPDPTPSGTVTSTPVESVTVPVYFVGETPQGPKLYREFRRVEADNPLEEAAALMTAGDALDPDYRSLYPGGTFASVAVEEGRIVATLADAAWEERGGLSGIEAQLATQQLVLTVQGVQQERLPVVVEREGRPTSLFGHDTADGLRNAPSIDVLAFVNLTTPAEGDAVSGSFTATGVASSFEATVPWELVDLDGTVVKEGFATAEGWGDKLYPFETEVDLTGVEPGVYTFVARTDDPSDGEGFGPTEDTKGIVVE
ncbi:Gmad2 immunoglobulin-like domain-containing protein [Nocardioides sp. SYSU D00038]|uniref:Gmad2 immunoglobulin-like domain-containing protein n=1 Tax=Nocardioides sp. SYSU D00038 TaxID=2812554 RepID=UPI001967BE21|nr:Gmad2 immunoglobulin-like domain-containing protein [Nocardioides sp. SYSU D00038]